MRFDMKLLKNKTVIFFMIVILYELSKILLSKFNIEYRAAPARLFYWIIIIGIVSSFIFGIVRIIIDI